MAKEIPLNSGMVTIVDDEDFEFLNQWKWTYSKHKRKSTGYALRGTKKSDERKMFYMHREITKVSDGMYVDHINGNGLDNRKANLRICTSQQNKWNMKIPKNNTSGFKGVSWHPQTGKWRASIHINRKRKSLGLYSTKESAAFAYNAGAQKYHGEFARLNQL